MSIKKCIMNYFDKATNAMTPFHPQTESGAITDWHESIIGSLASKVLPTVVSELTTDSVLGKLMKMLLTASGVKYSIDTNGYVCLGSFFGGLIIQWENHPFENKENTVPLTGYTKVFEMAVHRTPASGIAPVAMRDIENNKFYIVSNGGTSASAYWFGIFMKTR